MPFIPTTDKNIQDMLNSIWIDSIEDLFREIPAELKIAELSEIPPASNEMMLARELKEAARQDTVALNFIGAGAYEHYVPAAIWDIVGRGEWLTAYTPYQAEASQGTLQLLYEYQSMMARLMQMEVSNASLYDGASALAEAVLMAIRCHPKTAKITKTAETDSIRILMPSTVHPFYREVVKTTVQAQSIEILELPFSLETGRIEKTNLEKYKKETITAIVIPQPNFFGVLEDVDMLCEFAEEKNALIIGLVNPIAMALLKPPGAWGKKGADIVCGEGQSLGVPLASGGPYFGFLCCRKEHIRQLPGRLVGRTTDSEGRQGFTLTLQAREQHIRRAKATSNICTNQGLLVTAATLYLSLMGNEGLFRVAVECHAKTALFRKKLNAIKDILGIKLLFSGSPFFHETVIQFNVPVNKVIEGMAVEGIESGFSLSRCYKKYDKAFQDALLVCVTETKTESDLDTFIATLKNVLNRLSG